MNTETILIVDDEFDVEMMVTAHFRHEIEGGAYRFLFARTGREAIDLLEAHPDVRIVAADIRMPEMSGLDLLRHIQQAALLDERYARVSVIMITAYSDREHIRGAMQGGAVDFLVKPLDLDELRSVIERIRSSAGEHGEFLGHSAAIVKLKETVRCLAPHDANVVLEGETGTGKSLLAGYIHRNSPRRNGPFVDLHCGAIPPALIESELFGHVKGAFTGAFRERPGKFQLAHQGTLFLDEINTLSLEMQITLLKAIEQQRFFPLGSDRAVQVDARVIAASQEPLAELVRRKQFREELYHRLNVVTITIPPLRERRTDIPLLANALLAQYNRRYQLCRSLSPAALEKLMQGEWSGNVRALANALENAVVLARQPEIQVADIPNEALSNPLRSMPPEQESRSDIVRQGAEAWMTELLHQEERDVLREVNAALLRAAWQVYQGNKTAIARRLGVARSTLYRLLREAQIEESEEDSK